MILSDVVISGLIGEVNKFCVFGVLIGFGVVLFGVPLIVFIGDFRIVLIEGLFVILSAHVVVVIEMVGSVCFNCCCADCVTSSCCFSSSIIVLSIGFGFGFVTIGDVFISFSFFVIDSSSFSTSFNSSFKSISSSFSRVFSSSNWFSSTLFNIWTELDSIGFIIGLSVDKDVLEGFDVIIVWTVFCSCDFFITWFE